MSAAGRKDEEDCRIWQRRLIDVLSHGLLAITIIFPCMNLGRMRQLSISYVCVVRSHAYPSHTTRCARGRKVLSSVVRMIVLTSSGGRSRLLQAMSIFLLYYCCYITCSKRHQQSLSQEQQQIENKARCPMTCCSYGRLPRASAGRRN